MNISLKPQLTEDEITAIKNYLTVLLKSPKLETRASFPVPNRINLYINGIPVMLYPGSWQVNFETRVLYIGSASRTQDIDASVRLAVIASIISLLGEWKHFVDDYGKAVTSLLLSNYNEMMQGIVVSQAPATGLAFNTKEGKMAAEIGGQWVAPNGEPVPVDGPSWTVVH